MSIEEAQQIFEKLKNAWRSNQLSDCGNLLTEMKVRKATLFYFPPPKKIATYKHALPPQNKYVHVFYVYFIFVSA